MNISTTVCVGFSRIFCFNCLQQQKEDLLKKAQITRSIIDRTGQQASPTQYNNQPMQHSLPPPPAQQTASPPPRQNVPMQPQQSSSPPQQRGMSPQREAPPQQHGPPSVMSTPPRQRNYATPPRQRNHATPPRQEQAGYFPDFNGRAQSPRESRDSHRPPPHPRRSGATPDVEWARRDLRQNGTPGGRVSNRVISHISYYSLNTCTALSGCICLFELTTSLSSKLSST